MAKCKKCGCGTRISSQTVQNLKAGCIDVCRQPVCAEPDVLNIMTPLIYDEIGVNLCATFDLGTAISTTYPTAADATVSIVDIAYTYGEDNVTLVPISGRPNCYLVSLSNLQVTFAINLYDCACRLLGTIYPTITYLPSDTTAPTYDEDTNPDSVGLEIFAPYGISYNPGVAGDDPTPALNFIGFTSDNNLITQGINLFALPKLLNFDIAENTASVGLTLTLQSVYFAGYKVESAGRIVTPKGNLVSADNSDCMSFVCGDLLNLAIKPLELNGGSCCDSSAQSSSCSSPCNKGYCKSPCDNACETSSQEDSYTGTSDNSCCMEGKCNSRCNNNGSF